MRKLIMRRDSPLTLLSCSTPLRFALCDHIPLHVQPEIADITNLAATHRLFLGDDYNIFLDSVPVGIDSAVDGHPARPRRPPCDGIPPHLSFPFDQDRESCTHATRALLQHLRLTHTLKMLEGFDWWARTNTDTRWLCNAPQVSRPQTLSSTSPLASTTHPLAQQPWCLHHR